ncbi:hypothetical protein RRG08_049724 [Elysia crispata]|uniref:Uncharacterized protein n=1 Tax=Elysia crispata TaxID=231223 RepID=A0AAE0Y8H8_9GAST|nr:hypothetical protein RRG08_049724 [Elysia crispata]
MTACYRIVCYEQQGLCAMTLRATVLCAMSSRDCVAMTLRATVLCAMSSRDSGTVCRNDSACYRIVCYEQQGLCVAMTLRATKLCAMSSRDCVSHLVAAVANQGY